MFSPIFSDSFFSLLPKSFRPRLEANIIAKLLKTNVNCQRKRIYAVSLFISSQVLKVGIVFRIRLEIQELRIT